MRTISLTTTKKNTSEAMIDGLFGGILGGLGMLVFLLLGGLLEGASVVETLGRFGVPNQATTPISSALLHLGVSAVYGAIFGIVLNLLTTRRLWGLPGWAWGMGYGLVLWLLAASLLLPTTGSALLEFPAWQFITAHLVYGGILGWFCSRSSH